MKWKLPVLRLLLASVCVINLFLGLAAFASKDLILQVIQTIYRVPLTDLAGHTLYIIKMLGCFLIAIAVMAGLAIRNPAQHRVIILGNVIWLTLRGIQRITYVEQFHQDWNIPYAMLWGQIAVVFTIAALLLWLMPKAEPTTK